MGSYIPVDSYQASVSTKYNKKMPVPPLLGIWNISLHAPAPLPSSSVKCLSTSPWWWRRSAASRGLLRLWHHGRVRGAHFLELCFVNFVLLRFSGLWSGTLRIIAIILFLRMKPDKKVAQVPILMKNMMREHQCLTHTFNIRYECFHNQMIIDNWRSSRRTWDAALLRHHQGKVAKQLAYGEGGGTGACRARFSVG